MLINAEAVSINIKLSVIIGLVIRTRLDITAVGGKFGKQIGT